MRPPITRPAKCPPTVYGITADGERVRILNAHNRHPATCLECYSYVGGTHGRSVVSVDDARPAVVHRTCADRMAARA